MDRKQVFSQFTHQEPQQVLEELKSSEKGLTEKEAKARLRIYGPNEVKARETNWLDILVRQFRSPFVYLLFLAALVAFLIGEKIDGPVILFFVFLNVVLGFYQEFRAQKAAALLKKYVPEKIQVWREGGKKIIDKKDLVPGDLVLLEAGDIGPADLRLIKARNLLVDEAVLTGESAPVVKDPKPLAEAIQEIFKAQNIVFAGTSVVAGKGQGVVTATGKKTVFGEITKLVAGIGRESAYEKNLFSFSRLILKIVVASIVLLFLANLIIRGTTNFSDFLIFCIALVVSIIPEALPTVVTFALSQGALHLAKQKVVVKRLSAVEDLGDIEILCTDKTGTLTEGQLELEKTVSFDQNKCLFYGLLVSGYPDGEIKSATDPFDLALYQKTAGQIRQQIAGFQVVEETPFDPTRLRRTAILKDKNDNLILVVKGAPEAVLKISSQVEGGLTKRQIKQGIIKESQEGKRVLAVAYKRLLASNLVDGQSVEEKDLTFLGYFVFQDPLKKTAMEAVKMAQKLGVQIKMVTGDSSEVAGWVAKEVGLVENPKQVILGEQIEKFSSSQLEKACEEYSVFARVAPKTKLKIVQALAKKYEVGFLGEGINDALALKAAQVALVVSQAVDVSKEVADIILLKKDLKIIINGVKEGRQIFANINKYIKCTLSSNFGNFYSIAVVSLFVPFLPLLPVQILLVNLLSDFPLIAIASDKVDIEELRKPKALQLKQVIWLMVLLASISTLFDFLFFGIFQRLGPGLLRTLWFAESILTEIVLIFSVRTRNLFWKTRRPSWPLLAMVVLTLITTLTLPFLRFGQRAFHLVSPPLGPLMVVLGLIAIYFSVSEGAKLFYFRKLVKQTA